VRPAPAALDLANPARPPHLQLQGFGSAAFDFGTSGVQTGGDLRHGLTLGIAEQNLGSCTRATDSVRDCDSWRSRSPVRLSWARVLTNGIDSPPDGWDVDMPTPQSVVLQCYLEIDLPECPLRIPPSPPSFLQLAMSRNRQVVRPVKKPVTRRLDSAIIA
jgi:hypothetical protein